MRTETLPVLWMMSNFQNIQLQFQISARSFGIVSGWMDRQPAWKFGPLLYSVPKGSLDFVTIQSLRNSAVREYSLARTGLKPGEFNRTVLPLRLILNAFRGHCETNYIFDFRVGRNSRHLHMYHYLIT